MAKMKLSRSVVGFLLGAVGLLLSGCFFDSNDGESSGQNLGTGDGGGSAGAECDRAAECGDGRQCVRGVCQPVGSPMGDYCSPTLEWPESSAAKELAILDLVNQRRAAGATCGGATFGPREPLEMLDSLQCAARVHSLDMLENDYFSHTGLDGSGPDYRFEAAGYDGRGWGENIASGRSDAEGTMEQWMNSPGHCRNIMGDYRYIGVGHAGSGRQNIWTQAFGN